MPILEVYLPESEDDTMSLGLDPKDPNYDQIKKWVGFGLSYGFIEYLLQSKGKSPHCSGCRDFVCPSQGEGDDACKGFKYGEEW